MDVFVVALGMGALIFVVGRYLIQAALSVLTLLTAWEGGRHMYEFMKEYGGMLLCELVSVFVIISYFLPMLCGGTLGQIIMQYMAGLLG